MPARARGTGEDAMKRRTGGKLEPIAHHAHAKQEQTQTTNQRANQGKGIQRVRRHVMNLPTRTEATMSV